MAANSKIEWTDTTWNPVVGCTKVSPGCAHCYAEVMAARLKAMALAKIAEGKDPGRLRQYIDAVDEHGRWTGKLIPVPESLSDPLKWMQPRNIFVNSMSDLFHDSVENEFIATVLGVILLSGQHTFQLLTKRPERMRRLMMFLDVDKCLTAAALSNVELPGGNNRRQAAKMMQTVGRDPFIETAWPPINLILGVSVENKATAEERIPHLVRTPAAGRMVSAEPLLGPIDLTRIPVNDRQDYLDALRGEVCCRMTGCVVDEKSPAIDWVIVGGESGPHARPMHPDWARSIRDQCQAAGVPFFFKQWGEWEPIRVDNDQCCVPTIGRDQALGVSKDGKLCAIEHAGNRRIMKRCGKKTAGRLLDGRTWAEFPQAFTGSSSLSEVK